MIARTTFQDVIDHGLDYLGGNPSDSARRDCVRSALAAYKDLANAFNWSYLYTHGRVNTSGSYDSTSDGATVAFTLTGGAYERMVTITGGTWPVWAGDGTYIRVGVDDGNGVSSAVAYRVAERKSATVLTLTAALTPEDDIPSGSDFLLFRDTYLLPEDYISQDQALYERNFGGMQYTHPREWLFENRYVFAQGIPQYYTVTGDAQYPGRLVLRIFPWPYENKTIDFVYKRRPRPLNLTAITSGTVSISAGLQTVTGVGTTFTPAMVGSVIRIAASGTLPPASLIMGEDRPVFETIITSWTSATSVNVLDPADTTYTAMPYSVGDPVDIEEGAMLNAYLRGVEKQIGMSRTLKDKPSASRQYDQALAEAKAADSRSFTGRSAGQRAPMRRRLRDMPFNYNDIQ